MDITGTEQADIYDETAKGPGDWNTYRGLGGNDTLPQNLTNVIAATSTALPTSTPKRNCGSAIAIGRSIIHRSYAIVSNAKTLTSM